MSGDRKPLRTCIGCRGVFTKSEVVRIAATPGAAVIDYREKLPGRAVYICPRGECITRALSRDVLSRALRASVPAPDAGVFLESLRRAIEEKLRSLLQMSLKAGKLAAGFSAVRDGREKGRVALVLFARDVSDGSRERSDPGVSGMTMDVPFTKQQLGAFFGRDMVAMAGVLDEKFADSIVNELKRLKDLRNAGQ